MPGGGPRKPGGKPAASSLNRLVQVMLGHRRIRAQRIFERYPMAVHMIFQFEHRRGHARTWRRHHAGHHARRRAHHARRRRRHACVAMATRLAYASSKLDTLASSLAPRPLSSHNPWSWGEHKPGREEEECNTSMDGPHKIRGPRPPWRSLPSGC